MLINPLDHSILRAFLRRESYMFWYQGKDEQDVERKAFCRKLFKMINEWSPENGHDKFDYVHIQSLTNMGLLGSELVLTCNRWKTGQSLYLFLPPVKRGGIGFSIREGR